MQKIYARAQTEGKLKMKGMELTTLPEEVKSLGMLEIEGVPGYAVVDLTHIDVSHNALTSLPLEILDYDTLLALDASHNQLGDETVALLAQGAILAEQDGLPVWPRLAILSLASNKLSSFTFPPFPSLALLDVSGNALTQLGGDWPCLKELRASHNALSWLDLSAPALELLVLDHNRLQELHPDLGLFSPRLRQIDVSHNALTSLPQSLTAATALTQISLANNRNLGSLPDGLGAHLPALHTLDISGCGFATLPVESLLGSTSLTVLQAGSNGMTLVPPSIASLSSLVTLGLANNDLRTLPPELALAPALKHVGVIGNPFRGIRRSIVEKGSSALLAYLRTRLPEDALESDPRQSGGIFAASSSVSGSRVMPAGDGTLDLTSASLSALPGDLVQDPGPEAPVSRILAGRNALEELPPGLAGRVADTLEELDVSRNAISYFPETFLVSPACLLLHTLRLSHNRIHMLPSTLAALGPTLATLDVSYNPGIIIPFPLNDLPALTSVNLSGCRLEAWPFMDADPIPGSLVSLEVETNKLDYIPPPLDPDRAGLEILDIRNNDFTALPPGLGFMPSLNALMFDGNPSRRLIRIALKGTSSLKAALRRAAGVDD